MITPLIGELDNNENPRLQDQGTHVASLSIRLNFQKLKGHSSSRICLSCRQLVTTLLCPLVIQTGWLLGVPFGPVCAPPLFVSLLRG